MQFINQHSFSIFAFVLVAAVAAYLFRRPMSLRELSILLALLVGIWAAYTLFNPLASPAAEPSQVEIAFASGKPVLIEFESPY